MVIVKMSAFDSSKVSYGLLLNYFSNIESAFFVLLMLDELRLGKCNA